MEPKTVEVKFKDGSVMGRVVDLIVKKRPKGWSRRSYATYYKRIYAEWIQKDLDEMIVDRRPIVYRLDMWPKIKMDSLYLRVNQAIMYLTDPENGMDADGKYKNFRELVHIRREHRVGVVIELDPVLEGTEPRAEKFIGKTDLPKWRRKMDEYLADETIEEPFHMDGLLLTPDEVKQVELELSGLSNIMYYVDSREIKIVK